MISEHPEPAAEQWAAVLPLARSLMGEEAMVQGSMEASVATRPGLSRAPRLLFASGGGTTLPVQKADFRHSGSVLPSTASTASLREIARILGNNSGNFIHSEAPAKLLEHDLAGSCFGRLPFVYLEDAATVRRACRMIEKEFDGVVYSFANIIRSYDHLKLHPERLAGVERAYRNLSVYLRYLKVPIYIFGIGLQELLPFDRSTIWPPLLELLSIANRRAAIFSTRGDRTAGWLHRIGFRNAVALGCPSLFAYPENVLGLRLTSDPVRFTAGGHMNRAPRGRAGEPLLQRLATETCCDYVFQNDLFSLIGPGDHDGVYDEATSRVSNSFVERRLREYIRWKGRSFGAYYYFRSPAAWHSYAHSRDVFVGDRFHGAVAFMQAGRPALFVQADIRVQELTAFFDLPTVQLRHAADQPIRELLESKLSESALGVMKRTYRRRLAAFSDGCEAAGLRLARRDAIGELVRGGH